MLNIKLRKRGGVVEHFYHGLGFTNLSKFLELSFSPSNYFT
ncbi:hypothetical protein VDIAB_60006 [Vibrio diabolicus]|nr:hypothetical protein VDIAB_60006 [Vibrio diabolicus]